MSRVLPHRLGKRGVAVEAWQESIEVVACGHGQYCTPCSEVAQALQIVGIRSRPEERDLDRVGIAAGLLGALSQVGDSARELL